MWPPCRAARVALDRGGALVQHLPRGQTSHADSEEAYQHHRDEVYEALERLSGKRDQSIAGVSLGLIEAALEYQEDLHFSRVADERLSRKDRRIAHDKAWD